MLISKVNKMLILLAFPKDIFIDLERESKGKRERERNVREKKSVC